MCACVRERERESKGVHALIRFSEESLFPKMLKAVDPGLSQSGDLHLVVLIKINN